MINIRRISCISGDRAASVWALCPSQTGSPLSNLSAYFGLAGAAFLAATILPAQSELGLAILIQSQNYALFWLLMAASLGNIAGAVVNYALGRGLLQWKHRLSFKKPSIMAQSHTPHPPAKPPSAFYQKAVTFYDRYGKWCLLLSWMPLIGDPLTVIAGYMRLRFLSFLVIVAIAKITRYLIIAYLSLSLLASGDGYLYWSHFS